MIRIFDDYSFKNNFCLSESLFGKYKAKKTDMKSAFFFKK